LPPWEVIMRQLRQGDILIERLERLPDGLGIGDAAEARVVVLAAGEATGHAHRLEVPAGCRFRPASEAERAADPLLVGVAMLPAPATVTHEEHAPLTLPPGTWRISRQRRYDPTRHGRLAAD
jgi:hypothetical protein